MRPGAKLSPKCLACISTGWLWLARDGVPSCQNSSPHNPNRRRVKSAEAMLFHHPVYFPYWCRRLLFSLLFCFKNGNRHPLSGDDQVAPSGRSCSQSEGVVPIPIRSNLGLAIPSLISGRSIRNRSLSRKELTGSGYSSGRTRPPQTGRDVPVPVHIGSLTQLLLAGQVQLDRKY